MAHHYFEFGPFGDMGENGETESCKLVHGEEFGGILVFLIYFYYQRNDGKVVQQNE